MRVLGIFRKVLAQYTHLEEGQAAVHPASPPRQAELGDNPTMPPRATGLPSPKRPFPPETISQNRNLKELLIFRWYRRHLHLFCCCHLIAASPRLPNHPGEQPRPGDMEQPQASAWDLVSPCGKG